MSKMRLKAAGYKKVEDTLSQLERFGDRWSKERIEQTLEYYSSTFLAKYLLK